LAKIKDVLSAEDLRIRKMTDAANHQLTEWGVPLKDTDRVKNKAVTTFCGFTMRGVVATAAASSVAIAAIAAIFYQQ